MMEKSKLGISLNLFAALLYFTGAAEYIALVVAVPVGYVLLFEENEKLKRTAVKALIMAVIWVIVTFLVSSLSILSYTVLDALSHYNRIVGNNERLVSFYQLLRSIPPTISNIVRISKIVVFVILGLRAYRQIDVKIRWIDKILDRHTQCQK